MVQFENNFIGTPNNSLLKPPPDDDEDELYTSDIEMDDTIVDSALYMLTDEEASDIDIYPEMENDDDEDDDDDIDVIFSDDDESSSSECGTVYEAEESDVSDFNDSVSILSDHSEGTNSS